MIPGKPATQKPEDHRKATHRHHRPGSEASEIGRRRCPIGKCQRRQHAQKMGTPRQSVQGPDPESRVGMSRTPCMGCFGSVQMVRPMEVEMFMLTPVMFVPMGVHLDAKRPAQGPKSDPDEHDPYHPFAPHGDPFDRKHLAEGKCHHADQGDAGTVSQPPPGTGAPEIPMLPDRKRGHGCEMIRPGDHVHQPRQEPCNCDQHFRGPLCGLDSGEQARPPWHENPASQLRWAPPMIRVS